MSGFFGGGASKTNRGWQLQSAGDLSNVFNFGLPSTKTAQTAGQGFLSTAGDYFSKLLTGNRSTLLATTAPEANAARAQSDAQKRQLSTFGTARGGGTAGVNQKREDTTAATIDNMLFGAREKGAEGVTKVGGMELSDAAQLLGISEASATDLGKLGTEAKQQSDANNAALGQAAADIAIGLLFA